MREKAGVVLAAAGVGSRMGHKKQFMELMGKPLIHYSLDVFAELADVAKIVVVLPKDDLGAGEALVEAWYRGRYGSRERGELVIDVSVTEGGEKRQSSVLKGLQRLVDAVSVVLVRDAARPLLLVEDAQKVLDAARKYGAAVIGTPSTDSLKRVQGKDDDDRCVVEALPRDKVWRVQTPQSARLSDILAAYKKGKDRQGEEVEFTDEASALEAAGFAVRVVQGSWENIKITREGDDLLAQKILEARAERIS